MFLSLLVNDCILTYLKTKISCIYNFLYDMDPYLEGFFFFFFKLAPTSLKSWSVPSWRKLITSCYLFFKCNLIYTSVNRYRSSQEYYSMQANHTPNLIQSFYSWLSHTISQSQIILRTSYSSAMHDFKSWLCSFFWTYQLLLNV